jgi:hypothetical protein
MCVAQMFERMPQDVQNVVTPKIKSSLNSFEQRFALFLKEYEDFVKHLEDVRPVFHGIPYSFARPKPL